MTRRAKLTPEQDAAAAAAMVLVSQALTELASNRCACGSRKREHDPFCWRCSAAIREQRPDVFFGLGGSIKCGYVVAWQSAKAFLIEIGRIDAPPSVAPASPPEGSGFSGDGGRETGDVSQ